MAKPLSLTAEQEGQIEQASFALPDREAFIERVLERLEAEPEIGEGIIHRCCRELQRQFWTPPLTPSEAHRAAQLRKLG